MYRFLLTRRWLGLAAVVLVLVPVFLLLARWQWHRHLTRAAYNAAVSDNQARATVPLAAVLSPVPRVDPIAPLPPAALWRNVTVTGHYLTTGRPYVRRRTLNMSNGFWVIAPFLTDTGAVIVVNRGWTPAAGGPSVSPNVPAPPAGRVALTGRLRSSELGAARIPSDTPTDQTLALDVTQTAPAGHPVYPAYLELTASTPAEAPALTPIPLPELDAGPHVGYAVEWIAFALLAIGGYFVLARKEAQNIRALHGGDSAGDGSPDEAG